MKNKVLSKYTWFRIHSFTGVITGLLLFIICWSGSFAVISNELDWLVTPEERVSTTGEKVSWGDLERIVLTRYPDAEISSFSAPLYKNSSVSVVINLEDQESVRVYVDPYSGQILGQYSYFNLQRFFRSFHMNLFLPNGIGSYTVMFFSLTLLISLIAPLFFYKRWWKRFLRFKNGKGRAFWSELHKLVGLWSLWFILIIAVTGLWYLFEQFRGDIGDGKLNYVGSDTYALHQVPKPQKETTSSPLSLDEIVAIAEEHYPELNIDIIGKGWFSEDSNTIYLAGQDGFPLVRPRANQIQIDQLSGEVLWQNSASDLPLYWLWSNMADPLHFGNFAGLVSKIIWFLFGIALSGLIFTGTYLHAQRLISKLGSNSRYRWPGTSAALIVSLAVLIASIPFGFHEARNFYGPTVEGIKQLPTLAPGVKTVIISWVGLTIALLGVWLRLLWQPKTKPAILRKSGSGNTTSNERMMRLRI